MSDQQMRAALVKVREALTDERMGTWRYMEGSEIYDDFREAVEVIDAALSAPALPQGEPDTLEQWEAEAEAFHKATGYLRPGKDYGALSCHDEDREIQRKVAWRAWSGGRSFAHPPADAAMAPRVSESAAQQLLETAQTLDAINARTIERAERLKLDEGAAMAVLRAVEWYQPKYNGAPSCPCCGNQRHVGHAVDCELAALIDAPREPR